MVVGVAQQGHRERALTSEFQLDRLGDLGSGIAEKASAKRPGTWGMTE